MLKSTTLPLLLLLAVPLAGCESKPGIRAPAEKRTAAVGAPRGAADWKGAPHLDSDELGGLVNEEDLTPPEDPPPSGEVYPDSDAAALLGQQLPAPAEQPPSPRRASKEPAFDSDAAAAARDEAIPISKPKSAKPAPYTGR